MTVLASNNISSFGVVNEAEQQILISYEEDNKAAKTSVKYKERALEKFREERIENLQDRLNMLAQGQGGCLKFLKAIVCVAAAVSSVISGGTSLGLLATASALTSAMTIASAALSAIGAITQGLEQLHEALKQKKLILNDAQGQQIMAIINETQKWIEDEKNLLDGVHQDQKQSLEEYKLNLKDLEESFSAMINIGKGES